MSGGRPVPGGPECYRHPGRETWIRCQRCDKPICPDCMRDASVGFQCPDCVARGAKQTRSGRATYGGARSGDPRLTSWLLIALNGLVWIAIQATGGRASGLVDHLAIMPGGRCVLDDSGGRYFPAVAEQACTGSGVTWAPGVADGSVWQVATTMFTHIDLMHIAFNMLALFFLGPGLEHVIGRARFLAVYLGSGLVASSFVMVFAAETSLTVGASGSIFGLLAAHLVVGRKIGADLSQLLLWLGLNVLITFTAASISWQGHLGGFVGGGLLALAIVHAPRGPRRELLQWGAVVLVMLVTAAVVVTRVMMLQ